MVNDKWTMFKNYMHNELQISKDDVKNWIREAVQIEAKNLVAQAYGSFNIQKALEDAIYKREYWNNDKTLAKDVRKDVVEAIMKQLKFSINDIEIKDNRIL